MKITITRFPFESQLGGMETVVLNLAKGLRQKGHTVSFLGSCPTLLRLFAENGFESTKTSLPASPVSKKTFLIFFFLLPWAWWQRRKLLQKLEQSDAVYMLSLSEKLLLTQPLVQKNIRVIWGEHEALMNEDGQFRNWLYRNPFLPWYRRNSNFVTVVPVSERLAQEFHRLGGIQNIHVIPNGIDTNLFAPRHSEPNSDSFVPKKLVSLRQKYSYVIGTVARLKEEKGLREFALVAETLISKTPDIHFIIVGEGPLRKELEELIQAKKLQDSISLIGEVPAEEMPMAYASFDLALFLSQRWETFGQTPLESMAMGVPTILTSAFGFLTREIAPQLLVVNPQDLDEVVHLVEQIKKDSAFREQIVQKNLALVRNHFSATAMTNAYEELFAATPLSQSDS